MNKIIAFLTATILMLSLSVGALADGSTWTFPYYGACTSTENCVSVVNTADGGVAIKGYRAGIGDGVWGSSGASSNQGAGVLGDSGSQSQGVGVKGVAYAGSTPVWAKNINGGDNVGVWSDGRVIVNGTDFLAWTSGKGIIMKNATLCQRVSLHAGGGSLDFTTVTCP